MPVALIVFVVVPLIELWLLIKVGSLIGALPTVGLVLLTAAVGVALLRQQGLSTLLRARAKMEEGVLPLHELGEGICLALGGALLLTPGFVTDALGFACLIPGLRQGLVYWGLRQFKPRVSPHAAQTQRSQNPPQQRHTIEGEYRRDDER